MCERIHWKSKKPLKDSGRNIRSEDQGYRKQGCSRRKPRGHWCLGSRDAEQDTCIQNDHRSTRATSGKIKTKKYKEARTGGWIDNNAKGQQRSGKLINYQSKTT